MNKEDLEYYITTQEQISTELLELSDVLFGPLRALILQVCEIKSYYYAKQYQTPQATEQLQTLNQYPDSDFCDEFFSQADIDILRYDMPLPFTETFTAIRPKHQRFVQRSLEKLEAMTTSNIDDELIEQHRFLCQAIPAIVMHTSSIFRTMFQLSGFQQGTPRFTTKNMLGKSKVLLAQQRLQDSQEFQNIMAVINAENTQKITKFDSMFIDATNTQLMMTDIGIDACLAEINAVNFTESKNPNSPFQLNRQLQVIFQDLKLIFNRLKETFSNFVEKMIHFDQIESILQPHPTVISLDLEHCDIYDQTGIKLLEILKHKECSLLTVNLGNNSRIDSTIQNHLETALVEKRRALGEFLFYIAGVCVANNVGLDVAWLLTKSLAPRTDKNYFDTTLLSNALKCNWLFADTPKKKAREDKSSQTFDVEITLETNSATLT